MEDYYTIQIYYTTGDSFGSETTTDTIGMVWKDLDKAKLALKYIQLHYDIVSEYKYKPLGNIREALCKPYWLYEDLDYWERCLNVENDEGEVQTISCFWVGYFETLHGAKIIKEDGSCVDSDLEFGYVSGGY